MNYYTQTIPCDLAEKLKEKGMPLKVHEEVFKGNGKHYVKSYWTTYAEVFDWLMEKEINVYIIKLVNGDMWHGVIGKEFRTEWYYTWHEAANAAIEKALELIKEK